MKKNEEKIIAYKGFDKDLKCRDFQYEVGKIYTIEDENIEVCERGFHACPCPIDVFKYYPPATSRYCRVEQGGNLDKSESDKVCSSQIKIGAEIGIPGIIKATFDYVRSHCTNENNAEVGKAATAGSFGAATAGSFGAGQISAFKGILKILDTLEVKEVDLKKEYDNYIESVGELNKDVLISLSMHFFELGLKASNPLTWEDIKLICDIAFEVACRFQRNMKGSLIYKEQHYQEVLKRFKAQKGE